jgi:hypothetical protein
MSGSAMLDGREAGCVLLLSKMNLELHASG